MYVNIYDFIYRLHTLFFGRHFCISKQIGMKYDSILKYIYYLISLAWLHLYAILFVDGPRSSKTD